jgi:hypothetical protein
MSRYDAGAPLRKNKSDPLPQRQEGPENTIVGGFKSGINAVVKGIFGDNESGGAGSKNCQSLSQRPAQTYPGKRGDAQSNSHQPSQSRPPQQPYAHHSAQPNAHHSAQSHANQPKRRDGGTLEARLPERRTVALPHENPTHWARVNQALDGGMKKMTTVKELQIALSYYNAHAQRCTFTPLHMALDAADMHHFFKDTLPFIIDIALELCVPHFSRELIPMKTRVFPLLSKHTTDFQSCLTSTLNTRQLAVQVFSKSLWRSYYQNTTPRFTTPSRSFCLSASSPACSLTYSCAPLSAETLSTHSICKVPPAGTTPRRR